MDFDFDPDEMADEMEEEAEAMAEEEAIDDQDDLDNELEDGGMGLGHAAVGGAIFGMAEEYGEDEAKRRAQEKKTIGDLPDDRPEGAVSLRKGKEQEKKAKKPPFEQWVHDIITGKKTLDDEL